MHHYASYFIYSTSSFTSITKQKCKKKKMLFIKHASAGQTIEKEEIKINRNKIIFRKINFQNEKIEIDIKQSNLRVKKEIIFLFFAFYLQTLN